MSTPQKWEFCDLLDDGTATYYGGSEGSHRIDQKSKSFLADALEHAEKRAASLGSKGWELVTVVHGKDYRTFYFKRPYE